MIKDVLPNYSAQVNLINEFLKINKTGFIDGHGHIFCMDYIPKDYFLLKGLLPFLDHNRNLLNTFIRFMHKIWPFSNKDGPELTADFLETAGKTQQAILDEWLSAYSNVEKQTGVKWAVTPQTIDFEFGFHQKPKYDYWQQVKEIGNLARKKEYLGRMLPFVFADPRRDDLHNIINYAIGELGFVGIKTYPSLGFLPSHAKLLPVWERVAELGLPVLAHCGPGGLCTRDNFIKVQGYSEFGVGYKYEHKTMIFTKKNFPFTNEWLEFFNHPKKWEYVSKQYQSKGHKGFKLCLAHLGSSNEVEKYRQGEKDSWFGYLLRYVKEYPGLYFDLSYESYRPEIIKYVCDEILAKDQDIAKKIIFGTDFYMTHCQKKYQEVVNDALKGYAPYLAQIARANFLEFVRPE